MPNKTPLTDAELNRLVKTYVGSAQDALLVRFARQLERDLATARKELEEAVGVISDLLGTYRKTNRPPDTIQKAEESLAEIKRCAERAQIFLKQHGGKDERPD